MLKTVVKSPKINHGVKYLAKYSSYVNPSESILNGFMATVGNTPLIKLERISKETGCNILVKCEYMNPGGKYPL